MFCLQVLVVGDSITRLIPTTAPGIDVKTFPGIDSERLLKEVGLASRAILYLLSPPTFIIYLFIGPMHIERSLYFQGGSAKIFPFDLTVQELRGP